MKLALKGVSNLEELINTLVALDIPEKCLTIDLSIARGLDYYTGTVFETMLNDLPSIGSICSGGRYDNLAEFIYYK
jgi:histidyl-tRNA synthetase